MTRYLIIGGGIVGLATAHALIGSGQITLVEKEHSLAQHQTGRNSGVIHSGIYYPPGSAKALMCRAGSRSMTAFAEQHGIALQRTGKLIVATSADELPGLERLYRRGLANGIDVRRLGPEQAREHEPFVAGVAALRVAETAIVDYPAVCRTLAAQLTAAGVELRLGCRVTGLRGGIVETDGGDVEADVVINCAGLYADRIAAEDARDTADARIVPFRGEYFELRPERRHLVKGLIYPVPDPDFPFLGVHLTRMVDGGVHAGPNAVLALAREGYRWRTVAPRDVADVLSYPGFWQLARHNLGAGLAEVVRSVSRKRFAAALARLVPDITADDLVPAPAGVRAQALKADGGLVEDFLIARRGRNVHVLNAPSPAATSAFEIGRHIAALATAD